MNSMGVEDGFMMGAIAHFLATIIGVMAAVCSMIGYILGPSKVPPLRFNEPDIDDSDLFAIATGNEEYLAAHCTLKPLPSLPKNKKKKKKSKPPKIDNPLIKDCIETLVGLGEKKSIARATVNKYFLNNPKTKTVDEFIAGVFKR